MFAFRGRDAKVVYTVDGVGDTDCVISPGLDDSGLEDDVTFTDFTLGDGLTFNKGLMSSCMESIPPTSGRVWSLGFNAAASFPVMAKPRCDIL